MPKRQLGTMVTCGFPKVTLEHDLRVAQLLRVDCVEVLPLWRKAPEAVQVRTQILELGLSIHSVHAGWGGQAILADRIDLASLDEPTWRESLADVKRCMDWAVTLGAKCLVVHPGGLSLESEQATRADALIRALEALADASAGAIRIGVENMPAGVFPGSWMNDLAELIARLDRLELGLVVDTGHGAIVDEAARQTESAKGWLCSTHVHDNDGRQDGHWIPGRGVIDWAVWISSLDAIGYDGPLMLECIRELRWLEPDILVEEADRLHALLGIE